MVDADSFSLAKPENVEKYKASAQITDKAILYAVKNAVAGTKIGDLCALSDKFIQEQADKVFTKLRDGKKIPRGISFPTTVNVNHVICHMSPLPGIDKEADVELKDGDLVKIELGTHIDYFPTGVAHSFVIGASKEKPVTGKDADLLMAAYKSSLAALRLLRPGKKNYDITDVVQKISKDAYGCIPVEGILSTQILPVTGEGEKQVIFNPTQQQRADVKAVEFAPGEVYNIDIVLSAGEGKPKLGSVRTTIYKRLPDATYGLKMQTSRKFLTEATQKFGMMPFNIRNMDNVKNARAGLVECVKHQLFLPHAVLEEKAGSNVASFMFTAMIMPNGAIQQITHYPFDESVIKSTIEISDEQVKEILALPLKF